MIKYSSDSIRYGLALIINHLIKNIANATKHEAMKINFPVEVKENISIVNIQRVNQRLVN